MSKPDKDPDSDSVCIKTVMAAELKAIQTLDPKKNANNLVGLAFSGGGIRSATFGLGVLEALKSKGLLKKIDYLSTVSGGGYIGAWLSANCRRAADCNEPDWLKPSTDWSQSIRHLRRYSNYLSPTFNLLGADTWSIATIWFRNTLLVQLMIFSAIAFLLLIPRGLFALFSIPNARVEWDFAVLILLGISSIFITSNLYTLKNSHHSSRTSQFWVQLTTVCPLIIVSLCLSKILWDFVEPWSAQHIAFSYGDILNSLKNNFLDFIDYFEPRFLVKKQYIHITIIIILYLSLALHTLISIKNNFTRAQQIKRISMAILAPLLPLAAFIAIMAAIMLFLNHEILFKGVDKAQWFAFVWGAPTVLCAFSLTVNLLIGLQGRDISENVREWWSRLCAWLAIYSFVCFLVAVVAVYGPLWLERLGFDGNLKELGTGWVGTTLAGLLAGKSASTGNPDTKGFTTKLKEVLAKIAPYLFIAGIVVAISFVLHLLIVIETHDNNFELNRLSLLGKTHQVEQQIDVQIAEKSNDNQAKEQLSGSVSKSISEEISTYNEHWRLLTQANKHFDIILILGGACLVMVGILGCRIDINEFSLNGFYRNRLVRCYLGATRKPTVRRPNGFTGFDDGDDFNMSLLLDENKKAFGPLHIVNCALNLGGSSDLTLHTRHSASFILTPLYCGSSYEVKKANGEIDYVINYRETQSYGGKVRQPTLGQAISVSGAAASPNMGYHTSPPVSFLMTLFNARLGWWFPNPTKSSCNTASPAFSLWYLVRELMGFPNEKANFLAISDGGHFENLAAYELVRRRCKVIIISDGECDPKLQFEGLSTLIRMCEVDKLVSKIDIDVRAVHPNSDAVWSQHCCAIGKIYYDEYKPNRDPDGWIIYIKAAMDGQEATTVLQYKATHPDFPHETTSDQFYAEDQFESYRSLGRNITKKLFDNIILKENEQINPLCSEEGYMHCLENLYEIFSPHPPK